MDFTDSFLDELEKISVRLNKAEEEGQARQFALVGSAALPVSNAVMNTVQHGRPIPKGTNPLRWAAANAVGGAMFGGGLPAIRNRIEENFQDKAKARRASTR